jgi:type VI secretion system protein ImpJ
MYLGPHHFQVQSRYFEDSIQFATSSLWFASYGLAGVELDADALHNGTVSLLHARGIFPDGLPFNMPESDALPEPRAIADLFPPTRDGITVMLAIPPRKPNGFNCSIPDGNGNGAAGLPLISPLDSRYVAESRVLHDENTGSDERPIRLGRKNMRLLIDTEPVGDLNTLPVARVVRDGSGHYAYDSEFVPPVVQIGASARLMLMVQRLIDILDEKSTAISRGAGKSLTEFSTREIANFWLLHAVNSALAPLRHELIAKRGHPEELYLELSRLAGALCTFALESHPRDLPLYHHDNLSECFQKLDRHIRAHLETIVPTNCISIPLTASGDYFYEGEIVDQRCLSRSRWVLAVRSQMGEAELMAKAPQLIKVCSPSFVRELVKRALPGLGLTHLAVPPAAISARVETFYFGISRSGPCWDHMAQTRRIGAYVPGEIPNPEVEILVVLDN